MNNEDIKKVEELLKHKNDYDVYCNSNVYRPYAISLEDWELIENLLEAYKEQKQMLIDRVKYTVGLEQDLFENASNYVVPVAKIKEIVDKCIPRGKNIITDEEEYQPNTNANSFLTHEILKLLEECDNK